jgi:hypothetical protein
MPPFQQKRTLAIYGASDYAVTADGGDYTVHVVVGVDPDGHMYLLDMWRKQAASDEWIEAFCKLVKDWKPMEWAEEQGQIKAGVGPFLDRMQRIRADRLIAQVHAQLADLCVARERRDQRLGHVGSSA